MTVTLVIQPVLLIVLLRIPIARFMQLTRKAPGSRRGSRQTELPLDPNRDEPVAVRQAPVVTRTQGYDPLAGWGNEPAARGNSAPERGARSKERITDATCDHQPFTTSSVKIQLSP